MNFSKIAKTILKLQKADLQLREKLISKKKLSEDYNTDMENLHVNNAEKLNEIIDEIGFPTIEKVGFEASEAAWLIIQHSISKPHFMKKCLGLLESEAKENKAYEKNLAYLTDRIAVFEGKPQLFGTQFDWDKKGELSPNDFDDNKKVNKRRLKLGLNTLEVQTELIREQAKKENQTAPNNIPEREKEFNLWKRKVGWIK